MHVIIITVGSDRYCYLYEHRSPIVSPRAGVDLGAVCADPRHARTRVDSGIRSAVSNGSVPARGVGGGKGGARYDDWTGREKTK